MELRHMRYFIAVAEELNFTKAASRLCIVQPSLSKQIKDLEDEVGVLLFERDKRKVCLTVAGSEFLKYAYETLASAAKAVTIAKQVVNNAEQKIKIGMNSAAEHFFLSDICTYLEQQNIALELNSDSCHNNIHDLKNFKIDVTFSRFAVKEIDYVSRLVKEEDLYLVMNKTSNKGNLSQTPYLAFSPFEDPIVNEQANHYIRQANIDVEKRIVTSNLFQFLNVFKSITCWSIVPQHLLEHLNCLTENIYLKVPLYLSYRKKNKGELIHLIEGQILHKN